VTSVEWVTLIVATVALAFSVGALVAALAKPGPPRACATHGHRFEGRYHKESTPMLKSVDRASVDAMIKLANATMQRTTTYVHDICVYCGDKRKP